MCWFSKTLHIIWQTVQDYNDHHKNISKKKSPQIIKESNLSVPNSSEGCKAQGQRTPIFQGLSFFKKILYFMTQFIGIGFPLPLLHHSSPLQSVNRCLLGTIGSPSYCHWGIAQQCRGLSIVSLWDHPWCFLGALSPDKRWKCRKACVREDERGQQRVSMSAIVGSGGTWTCFCNRFTIPGVPWMHQEDRDFRVSC